jgi:hypothetical protein
LDGWEEGRNVEVGVEDDVAVRGIDPRKQIAQAVEVLVNVTVDYESVSFAERPGRYTLPACGTSVAEKRILRSLLRPVRDEGR